MKTRLFITVLVTLAAGLACPDAQAQKSEALRKQFLKVKAAAERGNATAQAALGWRYDNGEGVEKNPAKAVMWYRKAAEQGHADAQFNLASCYTTGEGVEKDYSEAVKWGRKAAEQGHADAQCGLGYCYETGRGVKKDSAEAVKWYRKAAEQGNASGQNNLGECYAEGEGVEKNVMEAVKWYTRAANQGFAEAKVPLGILQNINREWQAKALKKHPELGIQGSAFNKAFLAEERVMQATRGLNVEDDWPMRLADHIASSQPAVSVPNTPAPAPAGNSIARLALDEVREAVGVDMVRENGVLKVPVQINGAITLKFVVDSGASEVLIPKDVFLTLIRAETIKESDFLPGKTFILANGSKVKSDRFILRSIKVGESTFADVEASVGDLDATLLLGQSFLSKFDEWKIDNKKSKLILTK